MFGKTIGDTHLIKYVCEINFPSSNLILDSAVVLNIDIFDKKIRYRVVN